MVYDYVVILTGFVCFLCPGMFNALSGYVLSDPQLRCSADHIVVWEEEVNSTAP